ncbi:MAG: hypothetical protein ABDI07_05930 [Candidatus Kryptonium sp.]
MKNEMNEPRYLSEYLEDIATEEETKPKTKTNGKIDWKYILILLLPFGTLILIGLILFKKFNRKNKEKSVSKSKNGTV